MPKKTYTIQDLWSAFLGGFNSTNNLWNAETFKGDMNDLVNQDDNFEGWYFNEYGEDYTV